MPLVRQHLFSAVHQLYVAWMSVVEAQGLDAMHSGRVQLPSTNRTANHTVRNSCGLQVALPTIQLPIDFTNHRVS